MRFKEFLIEATSGFNKWEKYFFNDNIITSTNNKSQLYNIDGKKLKNMFIPKNEKIIVVKQKTYNPKTLILWNDNEYRISLNDIAKPINNINTFSINPQYFNIVGEFDSWGFNKEIIKNITNQELLDDDIKKYLIALVENVYGKKNDKQVKEYFKKISQNRILINSINKYFLEIIGPEIARNKLHLSSSSKFIFPIDSNAELYDFKIIDDQEYVFSFKSARLKKRSNTIKASSINALIKNKFKNKFKNELKILEIISNTPIKDTPIVLSKYLNSEYSQKFKIPSNKSDLYELIKLEREIVNYLNLTLDFTEIINITIPTLLFIKLKIDEDGLIKYDDITYGEELKNVKLRTKNSPGHYIDRIGFQI